MSLIYRISCFFDNAIASAFRTYPKFVPFYSTLWTHIFCWFANARFGDIFHNSIFLSRRSKSGRTQQSQPAITRYFTLPLMGCIIRPPNAAFQAQEKAAPRSCDSMTLIFAAFSQSPAKHC